MTRYEQQEFVSLRYSDSLTIWAHAKIIGPTGKRTLERGEIYKVKIIGNCEQRKNKRIETWGAKNLLIGKYPLGKKVPTGTTLQETLK